MPLFNPSIDSAGIAGVTVGSQSGQICIGTSSTLMTGTGLLAGNSLSTDSTHSTTIGSLGILFQQNSSAVAGTNVGSSAAAAVGTEIDCPFVFSFNCGFTTLSDIRFAIGMRAGSGILTLVDSDSPAVAFVGFQFSTDRGDTSVQVMSSTGGAQTTTPTGVTLTALALYSFELASNGTTVTAKIYDGSGTVLSSNVISATLPTATTDLCPVIAAEPRTASAVGVFINSICGMYLASRR